MFTTNRETEFESRFKKAKANANDFFKLLELGHNCTVQEVDKAWRKQILIWHADKNPGHEKEAEEIAGLLNNARDVLRSDAKTREELAAATEKAKLEQERVEQEKQKAEKAKREQELREKAAKLTEDLRGLLSKISDLYNETMFKQADLTPENAPLTKHMLKSRISFTVHEEQKEQGGHSYITVKYSFERLLTRIFYKCFQKLNQEKHLCYSLDNSSPQGSINISFRALDNLDIEKHRSAIQTEFRTACSNYLDAYHRHLENTNAISDLRIPGIVNFYFADYDSPWDDDYKLKIVMDYWNIRSIPQNELLRSGRR